MNAVEIQVGFAFDDLEQIVACAVCHQVKFPPWRRGASDQSLLGLCQTDLDRVPNLIIFNLKDFSHDLLKIVHGNKLVKLFSISDSILLYDRRLQLLRP